MAHPLTIGGVEILPGTQLTIRIPVAPLYTHTEMAIPVRVIRGKKDGPRLFVSAAIHGDEINGVEIIRRLLLQKQLNRLTGTLIVVPVVNVYGYTARSRYLPDRRDLNRSFPGSPQGSMASRLAHTFIEEIVLNSTHGVDLHTGAIHRTNLPHVRVCLDQQEASTMAEAFRVPLIMHSNLRDGSLRQAVLDHDIPVLLYEAGEALRFDERSIQIGLRGILSVMRALGMVRRRVNTRKAINPLIAKDSKWVRASISGSLVQHKNIGDLVQKGEVIGLLTDPFGEEQAPVKATATGLIVGQSTMPLVYEGEALFNIAMLDHSDQVSQKLDTFEDNLEADIHLFDKPDDARLLES